MKSNQIIKANKPAGKPPIKYTFDFEVADQVSGEDWLIRKCQSKPCKAEKGGVHQWINWAIGRAKYAGVSEGRAFEIISKYSNRSEARARKWGLSIEAEFQKLWEWNPQKPDGISWQSGSKEAQAKKVFEAISKPKTRLKVVEREYRRQATYAITREGWIEPAEQLRVAFKSIFGVADPVCVKRIERGLGDVRFAKDWMEKPIKAIKPSSVGGWFVANASHGAKREDVLPHPRAVVLECDDEATPTTKQWEIIVNSPLPILTLTHSGGKSLHAIFDVGECQSAETYEARAKAIYDYFEVRGLRPDWSCKHPNRLTRIAGCTRAGEEQTLMLAGVGEPIEFIEVEEAENEKE